MPRWLHRFEQGCKLGNSLVLEELFGSQEPTGLASTGNNLHDEDGVATQRKEILMNAHLRLYPQYLLPDGREAVLYL
jgi:hypothetical protein